MKRVHGLTLVELLLSMALALFLVAAILQAYRIGKSALRWQFEVSRLEENGRHALGALARELAMAGFFGRTPLADLPGPVPEAPACGEGWVLDLDAPLDFLNDFVGDEARFTSGARLECLPESRLVRGSDSLAIKRTAALPSHSSAFELALRDLKDARWYLAGEAAGPLQAVFIDADGAASPAIGASIPLWELRVGVFYLRDYSRAPGDGVPTLCQERLGRDMRTVCLVEGVERLQVEFGIDTDRDGIPDLMAASPTSSQLASAITAHVHVLVRSLGELHPEPIAQSPRLGAVSVALPPDRYLRRVFSATVRLRNVMAQAGLHERQ